MLAGVALLASGCAVGQAACEARHANSPQSAGDCHFRNPPNPEEKPGASQWTIWTRFLTESNPAAAPTDPIPVRRLSQAALDALDPAANHIIRLGHSSVLLKLRGRYWLIDPMFSQRASPVQWAGPKRFHPTPLTLAELPPIEGVIISHDHYDHLDADTIEFLSGRAQRFFVPLGVGKRLQGMGVAAARIAEFDWWESAQFGDVRLTSVPTQHFSGRTAWDRNETLWSAWVIQSGDERIYYSGDTGHHPGFRQIGERFGGFDATLVENGEYDDYWPMVHMTPEQTVQAAKELRSKLLVPVHNGTFDLAFHSWRAPLDRVADAAARENMPLATPEFGEAVTLGQPRVNVLWWKPLR